MSFQIIFNARWRKKLCNRCWACGCDKPQNLCQDFQSSSDARPNQKRETQRKPRGLVNHHRKSNVDGQVLLKFTCCPAQKGTFVSGLFASSSFCLNALTWDSSLIRHRLQT